MPGSSAEFTSAFLLLPFFLQSWHGFAPAATGTRIGANTQKMGGPETAAASGSARRARLHLLGREERSSITTGRRVASPAMAQAASFPK